MSACMKPDQTSAKDEIQPANHQGQGKVCAKNASAPKINGVFFFLLGFFFINCHFSTMESMITVVV